MGLDILLPMGAVVIFMAVLTAAFVEYMLSVSPVSIEALVAATVYTFIMILCVVILLLLVDLLLLEYHRLSVSESGAWRP